MSFRRLFRRPTAPSMAKIILGLGNPGPEYINTRHNLGFMCLSDLAKDLGSSFDKKEGLARTSHATISEVPVLLARSQTYMNLSGDTAAALTAKYHLGPEDLIVIHDDLDLPLGHIRAKRGGGSGGHRGVGSVMNELGSADFIRLRLGIGRPTANHQSEKGEAVIDYVLDRFSEAESKIVTVVMSRAAQALKTVVTKGLEQAIQELSQPPSTKTSTQNTEVK